MLEVQTEEHHKESVRGHMMRPDLPGFGKVIERYQSNGYKDYTQYNKYKHTRCGFYVPKTEKVLLDQPCIITLNGDVETLIIDAERTIVNGNNKDIGTIKIETSSTSFLETSDRLTKIMIVDANIFKLDCFNAQNLCIIDCNIKQKLFEKTNHIMEITS